MRETHETDTGQQPDADDGPSIGAGEGFIKNLFPNFGFIRTDTGTDLFFLPTGVDAAVCRFKALRETERVTFEIFQHRRGLRARHVQRQATDA